jgi:hypothetical protein
MANNKLILRKLDSPWVTPVGDLTKDTVLTHEDLDNNFIYIRGELIYSTSLESGNIVLHKINGQKLLVPFSGGTDTFVTGGTYDNDTTLITLVKNDNNQITIDLSSLKNYFDTQISGLTADDIVDGSTNLFLTDGDKGAITVSNSGQTWTINPNALIYTTGATVIDNTIYFDRTDGLGAYSVDLTSIVSSFTADTYTTGTTLVGTTLYFNRTDGLSAYTVDLSSLTNGGSY